VSSSPLSPAIAGEMHEWAVSSGKGKAGFLHCVARSPRQENHQGMIKADGALEEAGVVLASAFSQQLGVGVTFVNRCF
jgi:hypothetical protein